MQKFDAIIIGAGQGGVPLAKKLAKAGWKTAIIEKRWIGGTCINDGCTPTKAMIACAEVAYTVANSRQWGITVPAYQVDFEKIVARKNEIVSSFRDGATKGLEKTDGLSIFYGTASFSGPKTIDIKLRTGNTETISAGQVFINTGASPKIPDLPGLAQVPYLTNTTVLDLQVLPSHLIVLGGSYIGLEFGQLFRRLGTQVTIIERSNLLKREDDDVSAAMKKIMEGAGITVHTGATVKQVEAHGDVVRVVLNTHGESKTITGSHLLLASGRVAQTKELHVENAGITLDEKGFIPVNDQLETSVAGIYALGDVKGGPAFTHISYNDHLILLKNLLHKEQATTSGRPVPYCVFTDPQLGRIGLTEKDAREKGLEIQVACLDMTKVARAIETGHTDGFMKAVVEKGSGKILGAAILGHNGGEIMSVLQIAMMAGMTAQQLREMIFAHPLYTESLNNLFMTITD
ncbi:mercuric reductase [Chitinophaga sancti]|uniref:Mercuric reductase n=1 Tax=Chitinophaga sancti TaxID=1004 RepID=A0A1K1MNX2_9BACT|nr:mercuric reductase [Chitinophaga sancti]WQD62850.1 mercuric reductase [Chitinophaga sancti]WQG91526.1 mercuric reductase [Chitinophaga sancti]SFW24866.1 Pyruvate/2-oxoglutarate dehydrogenase complex, dihydrolipoamide dehydrogenase (E3) component [Chitinophaga sancti]